MSSHTASEAAALIEQYQNAYDEYEAKVIEIDEELKKLKADNKGATAMLKGYIAGKGENEELAKKPQELALKTKAKIEELQAKKEELLSKMRDLQNMLNAVREELHYVEENEGVA